MNRFLLYSTLGCHLCEQAQQLLHELPEPVDWREVEIAEDDALVAQYGIRIPVLKSCASGNELGWPFDQEQLTVWIAQQRLSDSEGPYRP